MVRIQSCKKHILDHLKIFVFSVLFPQAETQLFKPNHLSINIYDKSYMFGEPMKSLVMIS